MTTEKLQLILDDLCVSSPMNYLNIAAEDELELGDAEKFNGMRFFQNPIFSVARADIPEFDLIKRPEVVGAHHFMPEDWLPGAKTVISIYFPIEKTTVEANKLDPLKPANEWFYARIDGHKFLLEAAKHVSSVLVDNGFSAVVPTLDSRFKIRADDPGDAIQSDFPNFSSNWSERHVAAATGLGTFGISTNFITKAGSAGRLISIVTNWEAKPTPKDYTDWLEYCNRCGACIKRCPVQAFGESGKAKDHDACGKYIHNVSLKYLPRYGCGKCMVKIPCEGRSMKNGGAI
ncbi:MAG: 4Fe-4S binding protein [Oscillospiraceae bacterium]|nr:4Fe-4S binding protein [Oscillospiraceae bacterium]